MYSMEFVEGVTACMWEGWNVCVGGWNKTVCVCGRGGIRLCVCGWEGWNQTVRGSKG